MSQTNKRYRADAELATLLKRAAEMNEPLEIITDGQVYELDVREPSSPSDIWRTYDPEEALRAVRESPRVTTPVEKDAVDALINEIRAERGQNSRGRPTDS